MSEHSTCQDPAVHEALPALVAGRLTDAARASVQSHVDGCVRCRDALSDLEVVRLHLRPAPALDVDAIAAAVVASTTGTPSRAASRSGRARVARGAGGWMVAAAALLVVALASGTVLHRLRRDPVRATAGAAAGRLPAGGRGAAVGSAPGTPELALDAALGLASDAALETLLVELDRIESLTPAEPGPGLTIDLPEGGS